MCRSGIPTELTCHWNPKMERDRWWAKSNPLINHDVRISRDQILSQQHKKRIPRHGTWTFYHSPIRIPVEKSGWSVSWWTSLKERGGMVTQHLLLKMRTYKRTMCVCGGPVCICFYYPVIFTWSVCVTSNFSNKIHNNNEKVTPCRQKSKSSGR